MRHELIFRDNEGYLMDTVRVNKRTLDDAAKAAFKHKLAKTARSVEIRKDGVRLASYTIKPQR